MTYEETHRAIRKYIRPMQIDLTPAATRAIKARHYLHDRAINVDAIDNNRWSRRGYYKIRNYDFALVIIIEISYIIY